ncbi:unnamed protein product [Rhizopus stolonifer]
MQDAHKADKETIKQEIEKAYADLEKTSAQTTHLQKEIQQKMESELQSGTDIQALEKEHKLLEQKQAEAIKQVYDEVEQLRKRLEQSEAYTVSHEERMLVAKEEMDRIMRRLRAIDQIANANDA